MALRPFQYQLGNIVFGRDTGIPIQQIDIQPYNVANEDFQVPRQDELRFGIDQLAPSPIIFQMSVIQNREIMHDPNWGSVPDDLFAEEGTLLPVLAREWKQRDVRLQWGASVPLLTCDRFGVVRRIYGRPGKFTHTARSPISNYINVQAEFRRLDTLAHDDIEFFIGPIAPGDPPVNAIRQLGDADSWVRFSMDGPFTDPQITYGGDTIELDIVIESGVTLEISSYPWQRRVVDSNGINHRAAVVGDTKFLDQINFEAGDTIPISWTATGTDSNTQLHFLWREAYNVF